MRNQQSLLIITSVAIILLLIYSDCKVKELAEKQPDISMGGRGVSITLDPKSNKTVFSVKVPSKGNIIVLTDKVVKVSTDNGKNWSYSTKDLSVSREAHMYNQ